LNGRGGIEAHDKVVAGVVLRLVFCGRFREEERAPVGDAAYHAARGEDLLAGCASNPRGKRGIFLVKIAIKNRAWKKRREGTWSKPAILFDLGQVARPDLRHKMLVCSLLSRFCLGGGRASVTGQPTTAISSYNIFTARWVSLFGRLVTWEKIQPWAKSSRRQENNAIILVLGEFRSIYLDGSLNFRASLTKSYLKFRGQRADLHKSYLEV
jgi:hypothetical protein